MKRKERYHGLDLWRGITICSMLCYHAVWNLVYLFGMKWFWYESAFAYCWQQSICWSFIFLSGFCWNLGKKQWKRAGFVFGFGMLIAVLMNLLQDEYVWFGILLFIGIAMFSMIFFDKILLHVHPVAGMLISFVLFFVTRNCNKRFLGFESWNYVGLPDEWYANWITTCLGFPKAGYILMDYFSFFPWIFLYVAGYFLYRLFERKDWMKVCYAPKNCFFEWMGRHALSIYMFHQPVIYALLFVLFRFV